MAKDQPAEPKTYDLTAHEAQMLGVIQENVNSLFSAVLTLIAQGRLGYQVTPLTQMKLENNFTRITLSELPPDVPAAQPAGAGVKEAGDDKRTV